jgi:uncharacterized membrane protein
MNKLIKSIVIAIGTIATVLLMKFLRFPPPVGQYLSGGTIAYAVIATLALSFGAGVGGVTGLLCLLIINVSHGFDVWTIPHILLVYIYGFIIGKIFENKSIKHAGNLAQFSAISAGIDILISVIANIISSARIMEHVNDIFYNLQGRTLSIIINSLIIGIIAFVLAFIWYKCSIMTIPLRSALASKRRIKRLALAAEKRAAIIAREKTLPVKKRLQLLNKRANDELRIIKAEMEIAANAYAYKESYYLDSPENTLKWYKEEDKDGIGFKGGIKVFFGAGKDVVNEATERYKDLREIHDYFEAALNMSLAQAEECDVRYRIAREKAILYGKQIAEIMKKIPVKDREAFSKMDALQTNPLQFDWQGAEKKLSLARKNYNKVDKQVSENFDSQIDGHSKRIQQQGTVTKQDMLEIGVTVLTRGVGNINRTRGLVKNIGEEKLKIYNAIASLTDSRIKATGFIDRVNEFDKSLLKSMEASEKVFNNVYNELFPAGDYSKTEKQREKRKAEGGAYFSDKELERIRYLREVLTCMMTVVDADIGL